METEIATMARENKAPIVNSRAYSACIVIGLSALGFAFYAHQTGNANSSAERGIASKTAANESLPILIDSVTVEQVNHSVASSVSGEVEPFRTTTVASEVGERMISRKVQRGDRVAPGQILALLFDGTAQIALAQAQHEFEQAKSTRMAAETDYQRLIVETDSARSQARAQVEQALSEVQRARSGSLQANAGQRKALSFTRKQEMRQAEDALAQTKVDEKLALTERNRQNYLLKEGAISRDAMDRVQAAYDSAVARRQSAEQGLSLAREGARQEDRDSAEAQVAGANAQVAATEHQVEQARASLRVAETRDTRLTAARQQIDTLKAREKETLDAVHSAEVALSKRQILAPFSGRILATTAEQGDMLAPGSQILKVGEIDKVKVVFAAPESIRPGLRVGQVMNITVDSLPGRKFSGEITALGYQADTRSRSFPIEVTVHNQDESLLPSMVARTCFNSGPSVSHILIPSSAITGGAHGETMVYLLKRDHAILREVKLGAPSGDSVEITSGLEIGDSIAAAPQRLTDGAAVRITGATASIR